MVKLRYNFILLLILIIESLFFSTIVQAGVSSTIDRNPVRTNETFELTLHMESAPISRPPLEGLPKELEIIRSTNFYQRSSVNGQSTVQAGWRFILKATQEGIFTIPSFEIDGEKTKAVQLKVLSPVSSTTIGGQQDAIQIKATVDAEDVYVQQQIIYTIRLYRAVQAQYASLTEPVMPGALLERLGEDRQFETDINGIRYIVLERHYVIFPQQQGVQTISPVTFTAEVSDGTKRYSTIGRLRARTKAVSLSTTPIEINVKSQPKEVKEWWLPATNVTLQEQWQPEPTEFRVGEPVTWSYNIRATGLTATQLPELLPANVEGLKFYPDTAQSTNETTVDGIVGVRKQKVAVVPTRAGILTVPELKLFWWNISNNKVETIVLPERTIEVLPSLDGDYGVKPDNKTVVEAISELPPTVDDQSLSEEMQQAEINNLNIREWKMLSIIFLLLWLITAFILMFRKNMLTTSSVKSKKESTLNTSSLDDIRRPCKKNSATKTHKAILKWCKEQEHFKHIKSVAELARTIKPGELSEQLTLLEQSLYSAEKSSWNGQKLATALKELSSTKNKVVASNVKQLPPLHLTDD